MFVSLEWIALQPAVSPFVIICQYSQQPQKLHSHHNVRDQCVKPSSSLATIHIVVQDSIFLHRNSEMKDGAQANRARDQFRIEYHWFRAFFLPIMSFSAGRAHNFLLRPSHNLLFRQLKFANFRSKFRILTLKPSDPNRLA